MSQLNAVSVPVMIIQFLDGMGLLGPTQAIFLILLSVVVFKVITGRE